MTDIKQDREYGRGLVLYVLTTGGDMTSAEVAESIVTLALEAGHPKLVGVSTAVVGGLLATLEAEGLVQKSDGVHSSRHGRVIPTWRLAHAGPTIYPTMPRPTPPSQMGASAKPGDPYDGMSRQQLMCVLAIHDEIAAATAEYMTKVDAIRASAARRLTQLGLTS